MTVPDQTEAAEYYFTYIDQVAGTDICQILEAQLSEACAFLEGISEDQSLGGVASGNPFTVCALAFISAGHVTHHMKILRARYLPRR